MKPPSDGPDQTVREAAFRSTRDGLKRPHIYTARKLAPAAVHSILAPPSDRLCISTMHENCTVGGSEMTALQELHMQYTTLAGPTTTESTLLLQGCQSC